MANCNLKTEYPEYEVSQRRIEDACGLHTRLFRAPHGLKTHVAEYLRRDRSVLAVHWTTFFEDWLPVDLEKFAKQISELEPGSILLLHDGAASSDEYRDRSQVITLTKMIVSECRRRSIPLAGLASVYPTLHRIRSDSERTRERQRANRSSSFAKSISATISVFKQWSGSQWCNDKRFPSIKCENMRNHREFGRFIRGFTIASHS